MWLDRYHGLLCDLDGCLVSGDTVLPGARELLAYAGERLWIISNNSTDTPSVLADTLIDLGLPIPAQRIVLAGTTAIQYVARTTPRARIMIYGSDDIIAYARALGLPSDEEHPEFVLLARDARFSYPRLNRIVRQIGGGAILIVSNEDATHPGADGYPVAETGALLEAVKACLPGLKYHPIGNP